MQDNKFYIEIVCHCPATFDSFTRVAICIRESSRKKLAYWIDLIDDPVPKAIPGPGLCFPPADDDPQLWISEKLAERMVMFLSQGEHDWYASHGPIEEDEFTMRFAELRV